MAGDHDKITQRSSMQCTVCRTVCSVQYIMCSRSTVKMDGGRNRIVSAVRKLGTREEQKRRRFIFIIRIVCLCLLRSCCSPYQRNHEFEVRVAKVLGSMNGMKVTLFPYAKLLYCGHADHPRAIEFEAHWQSYYSYRIHSKAPTQECQCIATFRCGGDLLADCCHCEKEGSLIA